MNFTLQSLANQACVVSKIMENVVVTYSGFTVFVERKIAKVIVDVIVETLMWFHGGWVLIVFFVCVVTGSAWGATRATRSGCRLEALAGCVRALSFVRNEPVHYSQRKT